MPASILAVGAQRRARAGAAASSTCSQLAGIGGAIRRRRRGVAGGCARLGADDSRRRRTEVVEGEAMAPTCSIAATSCASSSTATPTSRGSTPSTSRAWCRVPLIGDVPARGRTTRSLGACHRGTPRRAIRPRPAGHRRHRPEPAVLHPGRGAQRRPVPLRQRHDGARRRWPSPAAMPTAPTSAASRSPAVTDGIIEKMDVPPDYVVQPGDTIYVYERWL